MELWTEVRRRVLTGELSKRAVCREYGIHWQTLEKILQHAEPPYTNMVSQVLCDQHKHSEAKVLLRWLVHKLEEHYPESQPYYAGALNNLGDLLRKSIRHSEPLFRRALEVAEKSCGEEHPLVAAVLNNLALLLTAAGRVSEAPPLLRRVIEILLQFTKATGYPHPNLQQAIHKYIQLRQATGGSVADARTDLTDLFDEYGMAQG